jgi:hypothetical protein
MKRIHCDYGTIRTKGFPGNNSSSDMIFEEYDMIFEEVASHKVWPFTVEEEIGCVVLV